MSKGSEARTLQADPPKPLRPSLANARPKIELGAVRRFVTRVANPLDRKRFQRALVLMVGLPFLLMTLTAATLLWAIRGLVSANQAVVHTGQVIAQSFEALNLALEMDTAQQNYLESGEARLLKRYHQTSAGMDSAVNKLGTLVRDRDSELRQLDAIKAALAQWRQLVEQSIQNGPGGSSGYNARKDAVMEDIRGQFSRLVSAEQELRSSYLASSSEATRFTSRLGILLTLAVGFIIAVFAAYQLHAISRVYERALSTADRLSEEIAEREAHFRILAEAIPQMVWTTSPDGTPEYFNQRWLDYVGAPRQSYEPWLERVSLEDKAAAGSAWRSSLASGRAFTIELRLRDAADQYRWHLGLALPMRDERGAIVRWLGTFTDIADQKRAEEALTRVAAIVETSEDAIYSKDLEGRVRSWNRGAEKMFGYSANEMIGQPISTLSPPERKREADEMLEFLRRGESIDHFETVRVRKDGTLVEVSVSISPIRNSAGVITGASTIARNITERNRAAEALRKTEKLAATGRLAGTMAHEINNPLEAVTNLLYLINRNPSLEEKTREYTRMAISEVDRIGHIARQALGFYREAAAPVPVNIADLITNIVQLYSAGAQNKAVHIEAQLETQAHVPAFPGEMRQVFSNLIVNAVDAVPRGGIIKIRVKHGRDWKSRALGVRVLVSDNGPGIPVDSRPHIFEPFFTTKGEKGTGVGLWVSQGVIEKHSGSIRMKTSTRLAHGTTFSVFLRYA